MTFKARLLGGFLTVSLFTVINSIGGISAISIMNALSDHAYSNGTRGIIVAHYLFKAYDMMRVAQRDEALSTDDEHNKAAMDA